MSFQIGDRVERVVDTHLGMQVGDVGTVVGIMPGGLLVLKEYQGIDSHGSHVSSKFVLAQRDQLPPNGEADPTGKDPHQPGAKLDAGKLRPTLVIRDMARALEAVIKVATDGANKYTPGGWLEVPDAINRYEDADLRHMLKRFKGEAMDTDSGGLHLAHNAWNALAKLELHLREQEGKSK